ncbi:cyclic lactone autoinducer peptide [Clostridium thermobutyricum]|jgi:AgrD protein|uniref:Cyclic lactone autoinducer peptide n=2 Tax=Clostridium thermobutyricum TaxID=29372 RepID=N9WJK0_9CLOT|nr:cyclic lactone autoinducer peptide [Clostridium thermobutyricum]ENZ03286.1 cyclic lactone autoinducer peptide [Clostridium thermobutyricum]OPX46060.1 hypothetical protein CLTHE_28770 [Clostridium thermobutyricum DSM 4928]OPX46179.1 hypothetical protein CLTHE_29960 [Clostridium thermobutyricum DSM 4928]
MVKTINSKILFAAAAVATVFAGLVASSACLWSFYQPEEPECLSDK